MKSNRALEKIIRKELREYQRYFREALTNYELEPSPVRESLLEEYRRAIYVLRSILEIKWNAETDFYLGSKPRRKP